VASGRCGADMIEVPGELREAMAYYHGPAGCAWCDALPELVAAVERRLDVRCGEPLAGGAVSFVAEATCRDGTQAVLKVALRDDENAAEPAALTLLEGRRVVRMLAYDEVGHALLLQRLDPGTPLALAEPDEDRALSIAADLLRDVWLAPPPGHPFPLLADVASGIAETLPARSAARHVSRDLALRAVALLRDLAASEPEAVLLHRDYHGLNVLRHGEGWRIIDPKPVVGDRAFDLGCLIREDPGRVLADPHPTRRLARRVDLLCDALGTDRDRVVGWAVASGLWLGLDDWPEMVAVVDLLARCV
jgi:streptomycin 6-kinase